MSCRICGREACMESFHSLEEQEKYEEVEVTGVKLVLKQEAENEVAENEAD